MPLEEEQQEAPQPEDEGPPPEEEAAEADDLPPKEEAPKTPEVRPEVPPESEAVLFARPSSTDVAGELDEDERVSLAEIEPADEEDDGPGLTLPLVKINKKIREARKSVMVNAAAAIRRLDPVEPEGMRIDPHSGERLLPGYVPLAPLTFLAFVLNSGGFVSAFVYSTRSNPNYLFPFAIAYTLLMFHLYFYHISYHTRRRFRRFRQMVFILCFGGFLNFILYDLTTSSTVPTEHHTWLWRAFVCNAGLIVIILSHYIVLGRGFRRVKDTTGAKKT